MEIEIKTKNQGDQTTPNIFEGKISELEDNTE